MPEVGFPYSEQVLQSVWKELWFDAAGLCTEGGKPITVLDPGVLNNSDGPDFLNARIRIGDITFYGAVELHIHSVSWYAHQHHTDKNYNQVILHVVVETREITSVRCQNGTQPPVLNLMPHLSENLAGFLAQLDARVGLPCTRGIHFISEEALLAQIEKAHQEYLEKKVNDFFRFYDAGKIPSQAWKEALVLALFDGFGISKNRTNMVQAGRLFLLGGPEVKLQDFMAHIAAAEKAGELVWNTKGVRPNHHPRKRLQETCALAQVIMNLPFAHFLDTPFNQLWGSLVQSAVITGQHIRILYGTVYLPAMYALGSLIAHHRLQNEIVAEWSELRSPVPAFFTEKFGELHPETKKKLSRKLGTAHQIKNYCQLRRCTECEVLKKVIVS